MRHLIGDTELRDDELNKVTKRSVELPAGSQKLLHRWRRLLVGELEARNREENFAERYEEVLRNLPKDWYLFVRLLRALRKEYDSWSWSTCWVLDNWYWMPHARSQYRHIRRCRAERSRPIGTQPLRTRPRRPFDAAIVCWARMRTALCEFLRLWILILSGVAAPAFTHSVSRLHLASSG